MIINDKSGNKKVFFGTGLLRLCCNTVKLSNGFKGVALLIFGSCQFVEPGTKTSEKLPPENAEIALFFENKEDLKTLKDAISHLDTIFEKGTCEWKIETKNYTKNLNRYLTGCGELWMDFCEHSVAEDMKFCPCCGKRMLFINFNHD